MVYRAMRRWAALLFLCFPALPAWAENCWNRVGAAYGIDPLLLVAIAKVESSLNPKAINHNRNGTYDVGLMQINSANFSYLRAAGITQEKLYEPCTSIKAGAIILAGFIETHGYTWAAVGAYNAGSSPDRDEARRRYATKVWVKFTKLKKDQMERKRIVQKWWDWR
ncbi:MULTISPECIES: transglycosylase SLT domain-containing protein [unclassified Herbaspirillum]|uniref:transglycosylase SLT domain-containing protein n=1 Tax=unclassified Herbaspirillum TaxID=2624150 RepID=UPI001175A5D2|nr:MULTISPECIES: transglycosylase SLT domain-containing protein [unclassified Herbaspirillum]MBB5390543.1 soluble lytic murein transglycosylase-like protein [Herbaspirillum sp. SJZ102]TQK08969.1 transglycosylase-like protein with SLT domain [Herbaspirillum sp. SJZ130]TQK14344.1 transglycosylase-like protein with SLT domain [Herbaspirillum sp. SJZ106]TWC66639.1 transglycosylase-like protein with SLT domain [Herbaspirillum sp. SJZ099]